MNNLRRLQQDFQRHVYHRDPVMADQVVGTERASANQRLEVYADAYSLRLLEVLGNDFPGLKLLTGDSKFEKLARDYIASRPSQHFNVNGYGSDLAAFLSGTRPWADEPALGEMAKFEWAMALVFDAPDEPVVTVEDMAAIPPESWPGMLPVPQSGMQLLRLSWNAPAIRKAADTASALPELKKQESAIDWLVWRQDLTVYFRQMEIHEARTLEDMSAGANFGNICEGLCQWFSGDEAAGRAAGLLKRWVTDGLIREIWLDS